MSEVVNSDESTSNGIISNDGRVIKTVDGWTFSADMSDEALADVRGLIAANGLVHGGNQPAPSAEADRAAAADAAFARMMAAHPNATVIGGSPAAAAPIEAGRAAAGDAAFARMMAAHPNATVIGGATAVAAPEDRCEFPERSEAEQKEADAAFEKLLAQNPEAKEVLPGVYATAPN